MATPILIRDLGLKSYGKYNKRMGLYECPRCQKHFETRVNAVKSGNTTTCGCLFVDIPPRTKHGGKHTRIYVTWMGMHHRCNSGPHTRHYRWYSGISVCEEWREFAPFREWAFSHGYENHLVLDRIDSTGNYSPENCRFITQSENAKLAMKKRYGKPDQPRV